MDDDVFGQGQENCIRDVGTPGNIQDSSFDAKLSHVRQVTACGVCVLLVASCTLG